MNDRRQPLSGDALAPGLAAVAVERSQIVAVLWAFGTGWLLGAVSLALNGSWWWLPYQAAQFGSAMTIVVGMAWRPARRVLKGLSVLTALWWPFALVCMRLGLVGGLFRSPRVAEALWHGFANPMGGCVVVSSVVVVLLLVPRQWLAAVFLPLAVIITLSAASGSLGAVVAALVSAAVWWWTRFRRRERLRALLVGTSVAAVLVAGILPVDLLDPHAGLLKPGVVQRLFPPDFLAETATSPVFARLDAQVAGLRFFLRSPLSGIGQDEYGSAFAAQMDAGRVYPLGNAHNFPIQLLAEGGVLGFLAWGVPLALTFYWARRRVWYLAPLLAAVGWLNLIEVAFFWSGVFYGYWAVLGAALFDRDVALDDGSRTESPDPS